MAKQEKKNQEYIVTQEGVEKAVTSALDKYSEAEIAKNEKKDNFFTLKMFGKNIGGAILSKKSRQQIEGKYIQNSEKNIQNIAKLVLDSAKEYDKKPAPIPVPIPTQTSSKATQTKSEPEKNKKRRIIVPIAAAALIGGAIGAAIASRADVIIDKPNNITIEYDTTENTFDALADLEQSSDDLIIENRNLVDIIKGTQSDIREEASLVGRAYSEQERVDSENISLQFMDELDEIEADRDNSIAQYALIKEPTDAEKLEYSLKQLDVQNKSLNFKINVLTKAIELKDEQSQLIQEHSDAGYDKESHSKELQGNESLVGYYEEEIQTAQDDLVRNNHIQNHFKNINLAQVNDFEEYFNAYVAGVKNTEIDKLEDFDKTFSDQLKASKSNNQAKFYDFDRE